MELGRRTWLATIRLAVVLSAVAALVAAAASSLGDIPPVAVVVPVVVVAFTASWVQTGRIRRAARGRTGPVRIDPAPTPIS